MLLRVALLVFGLLLARSATADQKPFPLTQICPYQTVLMRKLALRGVFDIPPAINTLMLNVIDGKMPQVRQQLSEMNRGDAVRWRQSALIIAAYAREPAMVAGLLDDGALVDGQGTLPALDGKFRDQLLAEVKKDPEWDSVDPDPKTARLLDADFLFDGRPEGPVATIAAECGDLATLDVALSHHANLKARMPHDNDVMAMAVMANDPIIVKRLLDHGADPSNAANESADGLITAIVEGNAAMVTLLLDHGANPCAEYRSRQQRIDAYQTEHHKPKKVLPTDAEIGRRKNLPDDLVARLSCPAFDAASTRVH